MTLRKLLLELSKLALAHKVETIKKLTQEVGA